MRREVAGFTRGVLPRCAPHRHGAQPCIRPATVIFHIGRRTFMSKLELSPDRQFVGLVFSSVSRTVFAQIKERIGTSQRLRMYFRNVDQDEYESISGFDAQDSLEDPVACATTGRLFFNVSHERNESVGFDWKGVYAFSPSTAECTLVVDDSRLRANANDGRRAWVSRVLNASGDELECVCAFADLPVGNATKMQYWITRIDLRTCAAERITRLPKSFL